MIQAAISATEEHASILIENQGRTSVRNLFCQKAQCGTTLILP